MRTRLEKLRQKAEARKQQQSQEVGRTVLAGNSCYRSAKKAMSLRKLERKREEVLYKGKEKVSPEKGRERSGRNSVEGSNSTGQN